MNLLQRLFKKRENDIFEEMLITANYLIDKGIEIKIKTGIDGKKWLEVKESECYFSYEYEREYIHICNKRRGVKYYKNGDVEDKKNYMYFKEMIEKAYSRQQENKKKKEQEREQEREEEDRRIKMIVEEKILEYLK